MDENPKVLENEENVSSEKELLNRRNFLMGLGKWSLAVIGGTLLSGSLLNPKHEGNAGAAWANRGGGGHGWANRGGGGGAWANRHGGGGGWANRGRTWVNGGGGWINRGGAWVNRGAGWANRGTAWVNRY